MKNQLRILLILLCAPLCSLAQNYSVVHTTGRIQHGEIKSFLKTGDLVKSNQTLVFPGRNAWMIVINEKGEQFFISQPALPDTLLQVKSSLQAIEKTIHPVTRSSTAPVKNLRTYFAGAQFVFIGNDFYLEVDSTEYPLDEKLFLLYRYVYNERTITHKIPQQNHILHFNKPFLYEYKGDTIPYTQTTKTELSYFNSHTNLPSYAAGFRPIWLNEDIIKQELLVLQKIYSGLKMPGPELKKVFLQYVLDVYGKTDEVIFMQWVEQKVLSQK